ncbi:MAG: hypothetical protein HY975_02145 [Candidatus Kerfeldbacteria bacterium]|nr:hypothetical protein [Candidatus Kerfeldbacteria bacterium]
MEIPTLPPTVSAPELELTQPPAPPSQVPVHPLRRRQRWVLLGLMTAIVAGLGIGGYFAYARGWLSIPFLTPNSSQLFQRMVTTLSDINNAQYSVRVHLATEPRQSSIKPFTTNTNLNDLATNANNPVGNALSLVNPDDIIQFLPADVTIDGGVTIYSEANRPLKEADALLKIDGSYTGDDSQFSIEFEARKKEQQLYALLTKFPSLPFFDLSGIKGKWIAITPTDVPSLWKDDVLQNADSHQAVESIKSGLTTVLEKKVFTVEKALATETVTGVRSKHYVIALHPETLPAVYQALIKERKTKNQSTTELEQQLAQLQKPEAASALQTLADNSQVEIWVDSVKGMLRQARWTMRVVPPDAAENLKEKQVVLAITLTLDKVNEPVTITAPTPTISFSEAGQLISGESETTPAEDTTTNINAAPTTSAYPCFSGSPTVSADSDTDGLMDAAEVYTYLTNPCLKDTDGDSHPDGTEVQNGYNPNGAGQATEAQRNSWGSL